MRVRVDYGEITSRYDSTGTCGHRIEKGDVIGWSRIHGALCAQCWSRSLRETKEAGDIEAGYMPQCL